MLKLFAPRYLVNMSFLWSRVFGKGNVEMMMVVPVQHKSEKIIVFLVLANYVCFLSHMLNCYVILGISSLSETKDLPG